MSADASFLSFGEAGGECCSSFFISQRLIFLNGTGNMACNISTAFEAARVATSRRVGIPKELVAAGEILVNGCVAAAPKAEP